MSDVTDDVVTVGHDGIDLPGDDPQVRIVSLTKRVIANPEKIGLRMRLANTLEQAGRLDEAIKVGSETVARFPANTVARARLESLRARAQAAATPIEPVAAPAPLRELEQPVPATIPPVSVEQAEKPSPDPIPERRFAAQDTLSHLARAAGSQPASTLPDAAALMAEPSLRLRLNPLRPRHRAEIYIAAGLIAVITLSGVFAWRSPGSGMLIDHGTPTAIVLAPLPPARMAAPPATSQAVALPPLAVPQAASSLEPDSLAAPPPRVVAATPSPPPASPGSALPPLPATAALPDVAVMVPAGDPRAAQEAAGMTAKLQQAGISVHPAQQTDSRQLAGITYFFAEDAAQARAVASALGQAAGPARQAPLPLGHEILPGAIRIVLTPER